MPAVEREIIEQLFQDLSTAPIRRFSDAAMSQDVPAMQGVYVIYDAAGVVLHVGRTVSALDGLRQRLRNHLQGKSSFVRAYLRGDHSALRSAGSFRCIAVQNDRLRALLEAYTIGRLCPAHIGLGVNPHIGELQ